MASPSPSISPNQQTVDNPRGRYPIIDNVGTRDRQTRVDSLGRRRFAPVRQNLLPCSPVKLAFSDANSNNAEAAFVRRLVVNLRVAGYNASHDGSGLLYGDNNLVYDASVPEDDQVIHVFAFGPSISWAVHHKLDLFWAVEFNRFYGPAFESFWEPSIDALGLATVRSTARTGSSSCGSGGITLRVKQLSALRDVDFGAVPGAFHSHRESVLQPRTVVRHLEAHLAAPALSAGPFGPSGPRR